MVAEAIIQTITGIAAVTVQMVYFLLDDREANHTAVDRKLKLYWHAAAGALHIWIAVVIGRQFGWQHGFFCGSLMWYMFDGCINTFVLKREWFYIGDTAQLDIAQRKVAAVLHIEHRLFSACLKHATLIISIILLIPDIV
jgi:hypothetical protein